MFTLLDVFTNVSVILTAIIESRNFQAKGQNEAKKKKEKYLKIYLVRKQGTARGKRQKIEIETLQITIMV